MMFKTVFIFWEDDFGKLVRQVDELLQARHAPEDIDACFDELAVDGRVDLRAFLHSRSTVAWFLSDGASAVHGAGHQLVDSAGELNAQDTQEAEIDALD